MAMGRYLAVLAVLVMTLACFMGHVSAVTDQEFQTMQNQLNELSNLVRSQAANISELEQLKEKFRLLEIDVDINRGQILGLEGNVYTLEGTVDDHETRITSTEENVEDLEKLNRSLSELEERVETLEGTAADHEARITSSEENVEGLQRMDINHNARITALEEKDTIAFHAALMDYNTICKHAAVKFNESVLNEGNGYDSTTGIFTVPPGGGGLYYFSTYLLVYQGQYAVFDIRLNDGTICTALGDHKDGGKDFAQATCSAVVSVVEGDEVKLVLILSSGDKPLAQGKISYLNGFSGFRI